MITSEVTEEQLALWKETYRLHGGSLKPNRISGAKLDGYFRNKYTPIPTENENFREAVYLNAKDTGNSDEPRVSVYTLDDGVYVGIDIVSGYFQVECEDIEKAVPIWDDLFITRGLSETDIENYVIAAQYILLSQE